MEVLKKTAEHFGISLTDEMLQKFEIYYQTLVEWNERMNLTAITAREEVYLKHFADSILPAAELKQGSSLCDVGTGAGFPGIPLKIVRPDLKVTLMDALGKRITFLEEVSKALCLDHVECIHMRAEDAGRGEYREKFDVVTSRAVARLNTLCEYTLPLVKVGGVFIAYKANCLDECAEASHAVAILGAKTEKVLPVELEDQHRSLIFLRKISSTPKKYPRGKGKEKNDPIL